MKRIILSGLTGFLCLLTQAQNDIDALRYTNKKFGSTAKSMSIAGAVGALGADISSASVNPAALAQFKRGEFSISLGFLNGSNNSTFLNNSVSDNTFKLNIPNVGLVFANRTSGSNKKKGWKNYSLGFNMARVADFNRVINYSGTNTSSSLMDYFAERANGYSISQIRATDDEFDFGFNSKTTMAWEAYLFDSVGDKRYAANANPILHDIYQKEILQQSGGMNEFNFSLAGNYNHLIYLGATISYTNVNFKEIRRHSEKNDPRVTDPFSMNNFTYSESLKTTGGGFSGRLGMVIRTSDFLRLGLSLQTPQILNLEDNYDFGIVSQINDGTTFDFESKEGSYSYSLLVPGRYTASATGIIGKYGFITGDIETVDYSSMRLRSDDKNPAMETANDLIRSKYTSAINYRLGAEIVLDDIRLRGGYANYGSPLKDVESSKNNSEFITGGIGLKTEYWALDLGIVHQRLRDIHQPYVLNNNSVPAVYADNFFKANSVVISLISKF